MRKLVFVDQIDFSGSPRVRAKLRMEVVEEYEAVYKSKKQKMPVPHIFTDGKSKKYLLADGRHRFEAALKAKLRGLECEVHEGSYRDAMKFALGANIAHGLQRSREDKREGVRTALTELPTMSNSQIAGICFVDDHTVQSVREQLEQDKEIPRTDERVGADGRAVTTNHKPKGDDIDRTGYPIPKTAMVFWKRRKEVQRLLDTFYAAKRTVQERKDAEDKMYWELGNAFFADVDKAIYSLKAAMPFAVCPTCQGHPELQPDNNCRHCGGRGMISEFRWQAVSPNIKKVREAACKSAK